MLDLDRRLREARVEGFVQSVGRKKRRGRPRDNFAMDLREEGEDVWRALRF